MADTAAQIARRNERIVLLERLARQIIAEERVDDTAKDEVTGEGLTTLEMQERPALYHLVNTELIDIYTHGQGGSTGCGTDHDPAPRDDPWWIFAGNLLTHIKRWPILTPPIGEPGVRLPAFEVRDPELRFVKFHYMLTETEAASTAMKNLTEKTAMLDALATFLSRNHYRATWNVELTWREELIINLQFTNRHFTTRASRNWRPTGPFGLLPAEPS